MALISIPREEIISVVDEQGDILDKSIIFNEIEVMLEEYPNPSDYLDNLNDEISDLTKSGNIEELEECYTLYRTMSLFNDIIEPFVENELLLFARNYCAENDCFYLECK